MKITDSKRWNVIHSMIEGISSQRKIAVDLEISRRSVQEIWKKYCETGSIANRKRCGRPPSTTLKERRALVIFSKRSPFSTAKMLQKSWSSDKNVSLTTVKRILRRYGLHGRRAALKPYLTKRQIKNRFKWCKSYITLDDKTLNSFIFSDESKIYLHSNQKCFIRRNKNSRFSNTNTIKTKKFGGGSLMVWGMIKSDGSRFLVRISGTVNSKEYQNILSQGLIPNYFSGEIFVQDGAPCHRSASTITYLESNRVCYVSDWPAQSPDLNIIENMWAQVKRKLIGQYFSSTDDLWISFEAEWNAIPTSYIKKLFNSFKSRMNAVIQTHGSSTKY